MAVIAGAGLGGDALPMNPQKWQTANGHRYMRVGRNSKGKGVWRWVKLGSPLYKQLERAYSDGTDPNHHDIPKLPKHPLRGIKHLKTIQQQRRLRKAGYKVEVDGIKGPETRSALKAFHAGISAKKWNTNWNGSSNSAPSGHDGGGGGGGGGGNNKHHGGGGGGGGGNAPAMPSGNVRKQARQITNLQYAPILDELHRQEKMAGARGEQAKTDIGQWFHQVMQARDEAAGNIEDAQQASQDDLGTAVAGIAHLFGGSANPAGGAEAGYAGAMRAMMEGLSQSENAFQQEMQPILATQRADALERTTRATTESLEDIASKLMQTQHEKGYALADNIQKLKAMALNNAIAQQEFGLKVQDMKLSRARTRAEIAASKQARRDKQNAGKKPPWKRVDTSSVRQSLMDPATGIAGSRGGLVYNPVRTLNLLGAELRNMGYDPAKNRRVDAWRDNLLRSMFLRNASSWPSWDIRPDGIYFHGKRAAKL